MPTNSLTDARCRSSKPEQKDYKLFDGGGLYLFVTYKGGKLWRLSYRFDGKPKTMSFGPYPEVSLSEARNRRDAARAKLRDGINPMAKKREHHRKDRTLRQATEEYWDGRQDISTSYRENARRGIEMHLVPSLGERDIRSITKDDLMVDLNRMNAAGLFVYVRKVRMWVGQVFDWAVAQGYADINVAALVDTKRAFGKRKVKSFAALDPRNVPDFMQRLALEKDTQAVLACRMLAYTWVRTNELRMMRFSEVDDKGVWIIPEGKMKRARDHLVPLPKQAIEILKEQKARSRGGEYVFQHPTRKDRPMSENAVLSVIYRLGYKEKMTGHGWRSVGSTWANEGKFNPDAIEMQLSHLPKDMTRAVYNRAKYLDERTQMLQAHADWIESCGQVNSGAAKGRQSPSERFMAHCDIRLR